MMTLVIFNISAIKEKPSMVCLMVKLFCATFRNEGVEFYVLVQQFNSFKFPLTGGT